MSKNILTVFIWGCWGYLRSKKFRMELIRHKFPLLRTTPSLIKMPIIQNPSHTGSSNHKVLRWKTLYHTASTMAVWFVLKNFKNPVLQWFCRIQILTTYSILSTTGNEMDFIKINHSIMFLENIGFEITDKLDSYFSLTGRELEVCIIYDGEAD